MGHWIDIVHAKDTAEVTRIMEVAGLQSGESEAIVLADQLAWKQFFSTTNKLFWKPDHVA